MYSEDYNKARKAGIRTYNNAVGQGEDPLLPILEEIVPNLSTLERVSLGVIVIPLDSIVGTLSEGRAYAFARNFLPVLSQNTEFATKWSTLYKSVQEQGVRDAIKAVEYMGKYYTVEGNKRVSVMKYMEADSVEADVVRYLPKRTSDPEIVAYYAYHDFSKTTQVYELMMSDAESYEKVQALTGHQPGAKWTKDERIDFVTVYRYFRTAYKSLGLVKGLGVGDAFLDYLVAYGYNVVKKKPQDEVLNDVRKLRQEYEFKGKGETMNLIMDNVQTHTLIPAFLRPSKVKAAFLYTRSPEDSGWNYWHEIGRMNADSTLGDKLETIACITPSRQDFNKKIEELITEGYKLIFATSPVMLNSCIKPSLEHPDVKFLCCSLLASYQNIRSYYLRFYESKFLMGLVAGIASKSGKIGYIADYPIYGMAASVNAFAIGARMVNPDAKIYLNWSTRKDFNEEQPFWDDEIRIVSNRDINAPRHSSRQYGLYERRGDGSVRNLAVLVPDWSRFYTSVIDNYLKGTFDGDQNGKTALNYWWGMSSGALDLVLSSHFDSYAGRLVQQFREGIEDGSFSPFEGLLRDAQGVVHCTPDRRLTPAEILCMDYFVDNVVGGFPAEEDLTDTALPIFRLQGIDGELKRDVSSISWKQN